MPLLHDYATSVDVGIVLRRCFISVRHFFFFFFNEELLHNEDTKKGTHAGNINHCKQCPCGLEENPTLSVNNSKVCGLAGNFAAMRQVQLNLCRMIWLFFINVFFD